MNISPWIMADAGFPLRHYLMIPYTVTERRHAKYNEVYSGTRVKIE